MRALYMENSSLRTLKIMPETSTKLYVHEFGFKTAGWQIYRSTYMYSGGEWQIDTTDQQMLEVELKTGCLFYPENIE